MRGFIGAMETPSPVTSVVIPCVIFEAARRSTSAKYSDWPRRSMKPGVTTRSFASTRAAAATTTAAAFRLRARLVHADGAAVVLGAVERLDRLLRIGVAHLHEPESLRAPRVAIHDDGRGLDGTVGLEEPSERGIVHSVREVSHIQLHSRWSFPS